LSEDQPLLETRFMTGEFLTGVSVNDGLWLAPLHTQSISMERTP